MTSTAVRVNTASYATTHVASNLLRSVRQIVREAGLDPVRLRNDWEVLENGVAMWLGSGHLRSLVLEVYDSTLPAGADLVGRFDFSIDYVYYGDGNGELWLDPDTVSYAVRKNGSYPSRCGYRLVVDTAPGAPTVYGWSNTLFRSTAGFTRHTVGAAIGGGNLGASLAYFTRNR
jgi:Bacterial HORMA domain 2